MLSNTQLHPYITTSEENFSIYVTDPVGVTSSIIRTK